MTSPFSTAVFGITTSSFFGDRSRVVSTRSSVTLPTVSPILIRSPTLNGRR